MKKVINFLFRKCYRICALLIFVIFSLRKPLKIGFLRLYNEENTILPCLMSVMNMLDKIVLIYSDIDDLSLELVKKYIQKNKLKNKFIIKKYPYSVLTQHAPEYFSGDFKWENTLAAYYEFGYKECRKLARFRNGFVCKIDADQIYIDDCFNQIEQLMTKEYFSNIHNAFGGYNGYVEPVSGGGCYFLNERDCLGIFNGFFGDHLIIPNWLTCFVNFRMDIKDGNAWEVLEVADVLKQFIVKKYNKPMWFHFNHKVLREGKRKSLSKEQYSEYQTKVFPLLREANSDYINLNINVTD